jgi:hypothetical protein
VDKVIWAWDEAIEQAHDCVIHSFEDTWIPQFDRYGERFYYNRLTELPQWTPPYRKGTFRAREIGLDDFFFITLVTDLLPSCPLADLFHLAPKDLWPNASMFLKQREAQERKEKQRNEAIEKAKRDADAEEKLRVEGEKKIREEAAATPVVEQVVTLEEYDTKRKKGKRKKSHFKKSALKSGDQYQSSRSIDGATTITEDLEGSMILTAESVTDNNTIESVLVSEDFQPPQPIVLSPDTARTDLDDAENGDSESDDNEGPSAGNALLNTMFSRGHVDKDADD